MDQHGEDAGAIAWPGFVDILSAVIIMFVFFVMITSIVMLVISVNTKQLIEAEGARKLQEEIQDMKSQILSKNEMSPEEFEIQIQKISEMHALNAQITEMSSQIAQLKADLAEARDQNAIVNQDRDEFTVLYQRNEMTILPDTEKRMIEFIENLREEKGKHFQITLQTGEDPSTVSISLSRKLGLSRMLNVRNVLLQNGVSPKQINVEFTESEDIEGTPHWVRMKAK